MASDVVESFPDRAKAAQVRDDLPAWVAAQCRRWSFDDHLQVCAKSTLVTDKHWETLRKYERKLDTPEGYELRELADGLRVAVEGWNFDWRLTAAQKAAAGKRIMTLIAALRSELDWLEGDGFTGGAGQWIHVMEYHDIRLHEQLQGVKATIAKWQRTPSPTSRPTGANAPRNFFIWYLADFFRRRYGRRLLEVVHACACAHFDSAIELELSAVSKIARRLD